MNLTLLGLGRLQAIFVKFRISSKSNQFFSSSSSSSVFLFVGCKFEFSALFTNIGTTTKQKLERFC